MEVNPKTRAGTRLEKLDQKPTPIQMTNCLDLQPTEKVIAMLMRGLAPVVSGTPMVMIY